METIRLHAPGMITRKVMETHTINVGQYIYMYLVFTREIFSPLNLCLLEHFCIVAKR